MSNPLSIAKYSEKKEAPSAPSDFDWKVQPKFFGFFVADSQSPPKPAISLKSTNPDTGFEIKVGKNNPMKLADFANGVIGHNVSMMIVYEVTFEGGAKKSFTGSTFPVPHDMAFDKESLRVVVYQDLSNHIEVTDLSNATIVGTTHMRLDNWPLIKFDTPIEIKLNPPTTSVP